MFLAMCSFVADVFLTTYYLRVRSLQENLKARPGNIDGDIVSHYGKAEVWLCTSFSRPIIGPCALHENNALELARPSARYISYQLKRVL